MLGPLEEPRVFPLSTHLWREGVRSNMHAFIESKATGR